MFCLINFSDVFVDIFLNLMQAERFKQVGKVKAFAYNWLYQKVWLVIQVGDKSPFINQKKVLFCVY